MPLKSKAQYRKLRVINPALAEEFYRSTPNFSKLPERAAPKKRVRKRRTRKRRIKQ